VGGWPAGGDRALEQVGERWGGGPDRTCRGVRCCRALLPLQFHSAAGARTMLIPPLSRGGGLTRLGVICLRKMTGCAFSLASGVSAPGSRYFRGSRASNAAATAAAATYCLMLPLTPTLHPGYSQRWGIKTRSRTRVYHSFVICSDN
jgi:hypothetical protein